MQWEYLTHFNVSEKQLADLGQHGWELISKIYHPGGEHHEPMRIENDGTCYMASATVYAASYEFTFKRRKD